jgi:hypothetical protein
MLDVHPPHHPAHSWRDFFIHIATIVVGLLIAVGLEQTVEALHHRHQRQEARNGIVADAQLFLHDVDDLIAANDQQVADLNARIIQVRRAIARTVPLGPPAYRPALAINTIRLGNIEAAKASGLFQLLPQEEVVALTEPEVSVMRANEYRQIVAEAARKRIVFEQQFQSGDPAGSFNFASITPEELKLYLQRLLGERVARTEYLSFLHECHQGAIAFLGGQRNIEEMREVSSKAPSH